MTGSVQDLGHEYKENTHLLGIVRADSTGEEGKQAFFRSLRRLNPEYTQAIASSLGSLPHSTLVMWGEKDPCQEQDYATKVAETIFYAELAWFEGARHWLIEEKPEEIAPHLARFRSFSSMNTEP